MTIPHAQRIVLCGTGFLGSNIARAIGQHASKSRTPIMLQVSSRNPARIHSVLSKELPDRVLTPPVAIDITQPNTLLPAVEGANIVVSLVGLLRGSPEEFEEVQWKGAESVARAAKNAGAKLIHVSAIGADPDSRIPSARTKGQAEMAVLDICPDATIVRPTIIFGPDDDFFNRFSRLSKFLPFLPVFGGGTALFQPIYVGDLSRGIDIMTRADPDIQKFIAGRITEAGGPDVMEFAELMKLVLRYNGRKRPIVSLPFTVGMMQGAIMEHLPQNLFSITRSQVEQLKLDNIVQMDAPKLYPDAFFSFAELLHRYSTDPLKRLEDVLPTYLVTLIDDITVDAVSASLVMSKLSNRLIALLQEVEPGAEFTGLPPAVKSSSGITYFVKSGTISEAEQYHGEAESLRAMANAAPGLAPRLLSSGVLEDGSPYFVSEYKTLKGFSSNPLAAQKLAMRLATELHAYQSEKGFGFHVPTYCGETRLHNGWHDSWDSCFSAMIEELLDYLGPHYADLKMKGQEVRIRVIPALLGDLKITPVLLHGDLWSGNVGIDSAGEPIIFDPASYYGHHEADLAISRIFGGFPSTFYTTYHEHLPKTHPVSQYGVRADLYELFHYLNHTVLFGGSYAQSALTKMEKLLAAFS